MTRTSLIAVTIAALLGATIEARQLRAEPSAWQAVAAALPPGAFVSIRLKDGRRFDGTIIGQGTDSLLFKPKTRIPVSAAEIAFRDIDSLEPRTPGKSPGMKVVIGVAIGVGATVLLALAAGGS